MTIRHALRARHILPLLAIRRTKHGSGLGRWRWVVERTFAWLNQVRRLRVQHSRTGNMSTSTIISIPAAAHVIRATATRVGSVRLMEARELCTRAQLRVLMRMSGLTLAKNGHLLPETLGIRLARADADADADADVREEQCLSVNASF